MNIGLQDERGYNQVFRPIGTTIERARRRHEWLAEQARNRSANRILEIGCGLGEAAYSVAVTTGVEVVGIDLSPAFIEEAQRRFSAPNLSYKVVDIWSDEFDKLERFDIVMGNGILHHLRPKLVDVLARLRSLARPGAGLAFIEPNLLHPACWFLFGTALGRKIGKLEPDEMAFWAGELCEAVSAAGWSSVEVKTGDLLLPGLPTFLTPPILSLEHWTKDSIAARFLGQSHFLTACSIN